MPVRLRAALSVCLASAYVCAAALNPALRIGTDLGAIDSAACVVDPSANPVAAMTAGGRLYVARGQDGFLPEIEVGADVPGAKTMPALAVDSSGITWVAWWVQVGAETYEAAWTSNPGGLFKAPSAIPGSATAQPLPIAVGLMKTGVFFGWSTGDGKVLASYGGGAAQQIATGSQATFDVDHNSVVHAAYVRGGDVFYANNVGGSFVGREQPVARTQYIESMPAIAVTADGFPLVLYRLEEGGRRNLYLTGGAFTTHRAIGLGLPVWQAAAIDALPDGDGYVALYAEGISVYCETGGRNLVGTRRQLFSLMGGEEALGVRADAFTYVHVTMRRTGALMYQNDAPPPRAAFEATPLEGEVPLSVEFASRATGHVLQYRWDFGDGERATTANPTHVYAARGKYTVTLRVIGTAGAFDELVAANSINVIPKRFHLSFPDIVVYDDQRLVAIPVKATSDTAIQGFTLAGRVDTAAMGLLAGDTFLDLSSTVTQFLQAEFVVPSQDPVSGTFIVGVIFDIFAPITGKAMPPCRGTSIANIVLELKGVPVHRQRLVVALENGVGNPPTFNAFTIHGSTTVHPELHPGSITVIRRAQEDLGRTFIRGDVNDNGRLGLDDAVALLGYLFRKGTPPRCFDAADIDDGGRIDLADPIALLSVLFNMSLSPAAPYPMPSLDPTTDTLPACQ